MAFQTGDIVLLVQKRIRDTAYDTSEIKQYLNDTQNDVFNEYRLPFMETSQSYATTPNVADITNGAGLPSNYSQAIDLFNTDANLVIPYKDIRDVDTIAQDPNFINTSKTVPGVMWTMYALTIILTPTPSVAYNVLLRYYKKPTLLVNDTDVPSIPSQHQELLVVGASWRIMEVKDNYDQAAVLKNQYDELLQKLVNQSSPKQVGHMTQMRINRYAAPRRNF
jgi:hypothetical protein